MTKKFKSFSEFKQFKNSELDIKACCYTKEEFLKIMKPIMCDVCRRIFSPTEEEKQQLKENYETDFTWEIKWKTD